MSAAPGPPPAPVQSRHNLRKKSGGWESVPKGTGGFEGDAERQAGVVGPRGGERPGFGGPHGSLRRLRLVAVAARGVLALAFLVGSAVRSAAEIFPTPSPPPYSEAAVNTYFYDEEGRAGLVPAWSYLTSPSTTLEVFVSDCSTTHLFYPAGYANFILPPGCSGSPFDFLIRVPGVGYYEGRSFVDFYYTRGTSEYYPIFVIPTTGERIGQQLALESRYLPPPSSGQAMSVSVFPIVSARQSKLETYATPLQASDLTELRILATVTYLAGSSFESYGRQSKELILRSGSSGHDYRFLLLDWSGYPVDDPSQWKLSEQVPEGPLSVSVWADGYTTDTIVLEPSNLTTYDWYPLLRPSPGSRAFAPVGLAFDRVIPAWMRPLIEDIVITILYSEPGPDENQDGVVDVSDILHILTQGP